MRLWLLIGGIALLTAVTKAAGPVVLGGRRLPEQANSVIVLLPPVVLGALVATSALSTGQRLHLDASTAGIAVAGILIWQRKPLLLSVLVAVLVTAGIRAL